MELIDIPNKIPLILLPNQVLLPVGNMKIETNNSQILMSYINKNIDSPIIIGVVPVEKDKIKKPQEGTIATAAIVNHIALPNRTMTLICGGLRRIRLNELYNGKNNITAKVSIIEDKIDAKSKEEVDELMTKLMTIMEKLFSDLTSHNLKIERALNSLSKGQLVDLCATFITTSFHEKLEILQTVDFLSRLKKVLPLAQRFIEDLGKQISLINRREQNIGIRSIGNKLFLPISANSDNNDSKDLEELKDKLNQAKLPAHAQKVVNSEFTRLKKMNPNNPESSVIRNYLELIAELPWSIETSKDIDINDAKLQLDHDHYGLHKLKRRIIEYLAVGKLKNNLRGPILCLIGPPGVGKTSVGRSLATIMGRKFQRISLGGISNQSDIRGHRRTYIGSMPGRILNAIKMAKTNNPVILLDEIDKLGLGTQGIPAAALLEVLDPEQNCNFVDHYLNIPFDLSKVVFVATANDITSIPTPLLDRMEVIKISGYSQEEKFQIAKKFLLPKQIKLHGLEPDMIVVPHSIINLLIQGYTKEAGVRGIERKLAALCRDVAVKVANSAVVETQLPVIMDSNKILEILGDSIYFEDDLLNRTGVPGVAVGLAYTSLGGSVLIVEATLLPISKNFRDRSTQSLILTGHLGDVIKESAQLALNWLRSVSYQYGLVEFGQDLLEDNELHIHFPAGSISKNGPSAGVTIATALMSLFSGHIVDTDMAFTGEITLQGVVLPVGGIREKILAAHRSGIKKIVLPKKSINQINEISKDILNSLELIYVSNMAEVIDVAFNGQIVITSSFNSIRSKL